MSEDVRFARVIDAAPEEVFDAFTGEDGQKAFYSEKGWIVESQCDLRVGGIWTVTFGPSRDELFHHEHVFRVIDRPRRIFVDTTESRPDRARRVPDRVHLQRAGRQNAHDDDPPWPPDRRAARRASGRCTGRFPRLEQAIQESR